MRGTIIRAAAALLLAAGARAAQKDWRFSSSLNYESGTYGTGVRSSSLYVPFTIKRLVGDAFASATVPLVSLTSPGGVTNVGGRPAKTGRGRPRAGTATHGGLGDIVLRGGYDLLHDDPDPIDLTPVLKLKLPTASREKGLGTGEFDFGGGLEAAKRVAGGWTVLFDLYLTAIGDPPGTDLNDQAAFDVGASHELAKSLTGTVYFEASNALVSGEPAPRDLRGILDYRVDDTVSLFGSLMVGLTEGASDYGLGFGGTVKF